MTARPQSISPWSLALLLPLLLGLLPGCSDDKESTPVEPLSVDELIDMNRSYTVVVQLEEHDNGTGAPSVRITLSAERLIDDEYHQVEILAARADGEPMYLNTGTSLAWLIKDGDLASTTPMDIEVDVNPDRTVSFLLTTPAEPEIIGFTDTIPAADPLEFELLSLGDFASVRMNGNMIMPGDHFTFSHTFSEPGVLITPLPDDVVSGTITAQGFGDELIIDEDIVADTAHVVYLYPSFSRDAPLDLSGE